MSTVPEFLRHDLIVGAPATVVLRSGVQLHGSLEAVDLVDDVVRIGGWAVRVEEIAGVRSGLVNAAESKPTAALASSSRSSAA